MIKLNKKEVIFLNPRTCGINKDGAVLYKIDVENSRRTKEINNEMLDQVEELLAGKLPTGANKINFNDAFNKKVLVPRYYDGRWLEEFNQLCSKHNLKSVSLGELQEEGILIVKNGHGSPSSDFRTGSIPYVKVSDIRALRVNTNPTNMVPLKIAEKYWRGKESGLKEWDLITPNRASSNIGEFAVILPGEERVVLTKEMFVFRASGNHPEWSAFYLFWALCLRAVRLQWQRVTLMQTNREDVANRYKEVLIPVPKNLQWAEEVSAPFRQYFTTIAAARSIFQTQAENADFEFVRNVRTADKIPISEEPVEETGLNDNTIETVT